MKHPPKLSHQQYTRRFIHLPREAINPGCLCCGPVLHETG